MRERTELRLVRLQDIARPERPKRRTDVAADAQAGNRGVSPTNAKAGQLSQKLAMERRTSSSANVKGNPNERMMVR